jgi:hypothetical protein
MQGEAKFMIYSIKEMPHLSNTDEFKSKVIVLNAQVKSFSCFQQNCFENSLFNKTKIFNEKHIFFFKNFSFVE